MKKIFAFCNQKGGVGKTTSVVNISAALAERGHKVLVLDLDSQANATSGLGEEKPSNHESTTYQLIVENSDVSSLARKTSFENLHIIPANTELSGVELELISRERREYALKARIQGLKDQFDFIFMDCPPSLGLLTINALTAADAIIIPLQCEYYALEGLSQLLATYQLVRQNLNPELEIGGVILTMADFRTNLTQQVIEEVKNYFKEKVFEAVIPRSVKLSEAPSFGKPAIIYDPSNRGSKNYLLVAQEFVNRFRSGKKLENPNESSRPAETVSIEEKAP